MCDCSDKIITKIYPVIQLGSLNINNGLSLSSNNIQLGGALVQNTSISGNYTLDIGTSGSRLSQLNLRSSSQLLLDYNNGTTGVTLQLSSSGAILTNGLANGSGLDGAADYSGHYGSNSYTQKVYVDSHLVSKAITSTLATPGSGQNGWYISWNNGAGKFDLVATSFVTPGSDTQLLFNDGGTINADARVTYNKATNIFTIGDFLVLGTSANAGSVKSISVQGSNTNIDFQVNTKGTGNINLALLSTGQLNLGFVSDNATTRSIAANGSATNINIALATKGTNGIVYIGDPTALGNYRYISIQGGNTNVSLVLQAKGTGDISLDGNNVLLGLSSEANTNKYIKAQSNTDCNLVLSPFGAGKILIGDIGVNNSDFYIQPINSTGNANLRINGYGTGVAIVNGFVTKRIAIGSWIMYHIGGVTGVQVAHGVTNYMTIVNIGVQINSDGGTINYPLDTGNNGSSSDTTKQGYVWKVDSNYIYLMRLTGGFFDSLNYVGSSNRGYVTFTYQP